jgi:hypothetical protein
MITGRYSCSGAPRSWRTNLEARTSDFVWAQSVTRTHWLTVKAGSPLLAAAACGGAITALTTWWSGPDNARFASAFEPGHFDTQGIVPIGYAVFASRYWPFQGIETGIYVLLAAALIAVTFVIVRRRDA